MGFLQVRGNSARVGHYIGYHGKTRMVDWHRMDAGNLVINGNHGNQTMVINKSDMSIFNETMRARSSVRLERRTLNP